jgi:hypothetical protein
VSWWVSCDTILAGGRTFAGWWWNILGTVSSTLS